MPQSCTPTVRSVMLCSNALISYDAHLSLISLLLFRLSTSWVSFVISKVDSVAAPSVPMQFKSRCNSASAAFLKIMFLIYFVALVHGLGVL